MQDKLNSTIDRLISKMYCANFDVIEKVYLEMIDCIILYLEEIEKNGKKISIDNELNYTQQAFFNKDYLLLSDVLEYMLKPALFVEKLQ